MLDGCALITLDFLGELVFGHEVPLECLAGFLLQELDELAEGAHVCGRAYVHDLVERSWVLHGSYSQHARILLVHKDR